MTFHKNGINAPCNGCVRRQVGCHSECEKYAQYKDAVQQAKEAYVERTQTEKDFRGCICTITYRKLYG